MYNAVTDVSVLAAGGKVVQADWSFQDAGPPVVWYGTSITQVARQTNFQLDPWNRDTSRSVYTIREV